MTAVPTAVGGSSGSGPFPTNHFTVVLDAEARIAIVGGNGLGAAVLGVSTTDGRTFDVAGSFAIVAGKDDACRSLPGPSYDSIRITIAGGSLTGTARGAVGVLGIDTIDSRTFDAILTGTADATPPSLNFWNGPPVATPFDSFGLFASEPLPMDAKARLVADDGVAVDLVPWIVAGDIPLVIGFKRPDGVLRAGHDYVVTTDGLVDFAGLKNALGPPVSIASFAPAPLVAEDGFESATGGVLGGAMVISTGALPAITGSTSLYIGGTGAPGLDERRSLLVRLARQPGDTKVRFSLRTIATQTATLFHGTVGVGSEGASRASIIYVPDMLTNQPLTVAGQAAFASPVGTTEIALPADATNEVLLSVDTIVDSCAPLYSFKSGLLIDDLRVE